MVGSSEPSGRGCCRSHQPSPRRPCDGTVRSCRLEVAPLSQPPAPPPLRGPLLCTTCSVASVFEFLLQPPAAFPPGVARSFGGGPFLSRRRRQLIDLLAPWCSLSAFPPPCLPAGSCRATSYPHLRHLRSVHTSMPICFPSVCACTCLSPWRFSVPGALVPWNQFCPQETKSCPTTCPWKPCLPAPTNMHIHLGQLPILSCPNG